MDDKPAFSQLPWGVGDECAIGGSWVKRKIHLRDSVK